MEDSKEYKFRFLILANAAIITFMATLDASILNVALPTIGESFSSGISKLQWLVSSYLLVISVFLLWWGRLADIKGRKFFFSLGLLIFTLGSLFCALSPSINFLIASRVLQGLGASMAMALNLAIVSSAFPSQSRGKALGIIGVVVAGGSLVGPSLGAVLIHYLGWRSIFYVNIPIGIIGYLMSLRVIPKTDKKSEPFALFPALLLSTSILLFFLTILLWQQNTIQVLFIIIGFGFALVFLLLFFKVQKHSEIKFLNTDIFKNAEFSLGLGSLLCAYMAIFAYNIFLPFYLQNYRHLSVLQTGFLMSVFPIVTSVFAPISGYLSDKISYKPLTVGGLGLSGFGFLLSLFFSPSLPITFIVLIMVCISLGFALFHTANSSSVMGSVPKASLGVAGGLIAFCRNLGMVSGIALAALIFYLSTGDSAKTSINENIKINLSSDIFMQGIHHVLIAGAIAAFFGAFLNLLRVKKIK